MNTLLSPLQDLAAQAAALLMRVEEAGESEAAEEEEVRGQVVGERGGGVRR